MESNDTRPGDADIVLFLISLVLATLLLLPEPELEFNDPANGKYASKSPRTNNTMSLLRSAKSFLYEGIPQRGSTLSQFISPFTVLVSTADRSVEGNTNTPRISRVSIQTEERRISRRLISDSRTRTRLVRFGVTSK